MNQDQTMNRCKFTLPRSGRCYNITNLSAPHCYKHVWEIQRPLVCHATLPEGGLCRSDDSVTDYFRCRLHWKFCDWRYYHENSVTGTQCTREALHPPDSHGSFCALHTSPNRFDEGERFSSKWPHPVPGETPTRAYTGTEYPNRSCSAETIQSWQAAFPDSRIGETAGPMNPELYAQIERYNVLPSAANNSGASNIQQMPQGPAGSDNRMIPGIANLRMYQQRNQQIPLDYGHTRPATEPTTNQLQAPQPLDRYVIQSQQTQQNPLGYGHARPTPPLGTATEQLTNQPLASQLFDTQGNLSQWTPQTPFMYGLPQATPLLGTAIQPTTYQQPAQNLLERLGIQNHLSSPVRSISQPSVSSVSEHGNTETPHRSGFPVLQFPPPGLSAPQGTTMQPGTYQQPRRQNILDRLGIQNHLSSPGSTSGQPGVSSVSEHRNTETPHRSEFPILQFPPPGLATPGPSSNQPTPIRERGIFPTPPGLLTSQPTTPVRERSNCITPPLSWDPDSFQRDIRQRKAQRQAQAQPRYQNDPEVSQSTRIIDPSSFRREIFQGQPQPQTPPPAPEQPSWRSRNNPPVSHPSSTDLSWRIRDPPTHTQPLPTAAPINNNNSSSNTVTQEQQQPQPPRWPILRSEQPQPPAAPSANRRRILRATGARHRKAPSGLRNEVSRSSSRSG
jgi:hypothetical protein